MERIWKSQRTAIAPILLAIAAGTAGAFFTGSIPEAFAREAADRPADSTAAGEIPETYHGTVIETMNTAGYTYVMIKVDGAEVWAAAPQFDVEPGTEVTFPTSLPMADHYSETLDRSFDVVYFTGRIFVGDIENPRPGLPPNHPPLASANAGAEADRAELDDFSGIEIADGGYSVAELFARGESLAGREVAVRGKVVKFSPNIMRRNWLHLRDGTGGEGTNDLTVTTDASARVGQTILVRGTLAVDKDFGAGYRFAVILEEASITVE